MAGLSAGTRDFSITISERSINGPVNLTETLLSGQTAEPEWLREGERFTNVVVLDEIPTKYTLAHRGNADNFALEAQAITDTENPDRKEIGRSLTKHLIQVLGLNDDLNSFYRKFGEDKVLSLTFRNLRGLRLMRGMDLFESLICSILSQNNSVRLWNRSARLMMNQYGKMLNFIDGSHGFLFPEPQVLANLNSRELRSNTAMGYRAKPIVMVSRMILKGELDLNKVANESYADAQKILLELPGVGPKVADCFLLYGARYLEAAPVDVWIHRIVTRLYFRGKKLSRMKTATFLRERFGEWAGYAQLYLFDYARR
jgi:N-glycosylase/DNA lyase